MNDSALQEVKTSEENEPLYTCNWDDSDWWTIYKLVHDQEKGWHHKVWLCIEGHKDDDKAKIITQALNQPPVDIITSYMEGAFDVVYDNDVVSWRRIKNGLIDSFRDYTKFVKAAEEFISSKQTQK